MNDAAMNIHVQVFVRTCVFISLGIYFLGVEFLGYTVTLFQLLGTTKLFSKVAGPFYIPSSNV